MGEQPSNFIDRFIYAQGHNEVPVQYYRWACISTIAAVLGRRVWVDKFKNGAKLAPNLYTVLLGPSGSGKGIAIDAALDLLEGHPVQPYRGKITAVGLVDHLAKRSRGATSAQVYLVTPEVSLSIGGMPLADDFIKLLTELYTGGNYPYQHETRTHGNATFKDATINWLGGSTHDWFVSCLTRAAIEGGALGRVCLIPAEYQRELRVYDPVVPPDHLEVRASLRQRLFDMALLEGQMHRTEEAHALEKQWYEIREDPTDPLMWPTYRRQHDLLLKLAVILSVAESDSLVIDRHHIAAARELTYEAQKAVPGVVRLSAAGSAMRGYVECREYLRKHKSASRTQLARYMSSRGVTSRRLDEFIQTLCLAGEVFSEMIGKGTWYSWCGGMAKQSARPPVVKEVLI